MNHVPLRNHSQDPRLIGAGQMTVALSFQEFEVNTCTIRQQTEIFRNTCRVLYFPIKALKNAPPHCPEIKTLVTLLFPTSRAAIRQITDTANYNKNLQLAEAKNLCEITKLTYAW